MGSVLGRGLPLAWLAVALLSLGYGWAALAVALGPGEHTTYAARSPVLATAVAVALLAAALAALRGADGHRVAALALLAACCWAAPDWVGWSDGPGLVRGLGGLAAPFLVPAVLHLVVVASGTRLTAARTLIAVSYATAGITAVGHALFRDPLGDPNCWDNCIVNVFLVRSRPAWVHGLDEVTGWLLLGVGSAQVVLMLWAGWSASAPARRLHWPVLAGGAVTGGALVAHALLVANRPERPSDPWFDATFNALACGMLLLSGGPLLGALRGARQRREVARIAVELGEGPKPGSLQSALGSTVGDPKLAIAYWLPSARRFVDGHGRAVDPPVAGPGVSITTLIHEEEPLATITHAASVTQAMQGLGAGTKLAFDNERLRAALLSQAEDIRASRQRIVEAADASRHRLERNLHDGAQQRLVALSYHLRRAGAAAAAEGDALPGELLATAVVESLLGLDELRTLAQGIYPAILVEAGLGPALEDLSDLAQVPVTVTLTMHHRVGIPIETAVYVAVRDALEDAVSRAATTVDVHVARHQDRLVVVVDDDGATRLSALAAVVDRIGALGGTVRVEPHTMRAELPCE